MSVLAGIALLMLITAGPSTPGALRAYQGNGDGGFLQVESAQPGKTCRYRGTWASSDGQRSLPSVVWDDYGTGGDCRYRPNDKIPTLSVGDAERVYAEGEKVGLIQAALVTASALYLASLVGVFALRWHRGRTTARG